jgi:hypothetical protein
MLGIRYAISLEQTMGYSVSDVTYSSSSTKSPASSPDNVSEPSLILLGARMWESHVTEVGARKVCEIRASSCHTKLQEFSGCNRAAPVTAEDIYVPNPCDASLFS